MSEWESLFASVMRILFEFIFIILVLFSMLFVYNVNSANHYISQCNAIVTRSGGLTKTAYDKCIHYSQEYYHGYYRPSIQGPHHDVSVEGYSNTNPASNHNDGYADSSVAFDAHNSKNYQKNETLFGQPTTYYLYSKVPFMGGMTYHSGHMYNTHKTPIEEDIHSYVRAGSQN